MIDTENNDAMVHAQTDIIKKAWKRVIAKRQETIISRLVGLYRSDELTPDKTYAAIAAIAELRSAINEIGPE